MNAIDVSIFQHGPVVIFRWRNAEHWPVEFVTPNVGELLGYSEDDFLQGRVHYSAQVHPYDISRVAEEALFHAGSSAVRFQHQDYRLIAKDGSVRWVEDHTRIIRDADGQATHFLGYVLDVTARKTAEASLRLGEAELRAMFSAVPDLLFKLDGNGVFLDYHAQNPADLVMPPEAFLGKCLLEVMPEPLGREGTETLQRALATGSVCSHIYELTTQEGVQRRFEARYTPTGEGGALAVVRDISERKEAEEALHRFRAALEASADAIYLIDRKQMRFVDANRVGWESLGFTRDELLQLGPHDIKPKFDREQLAARFDAVIRGEDVLGKIETVHRRKNNGDFPVEVFVRHLYSGGRDMLVAVVRDISERKQAEARLRESEARFKGIAQSMSDWIWEVDANGVYTFCSGRVEDILGYRPEEIVGRTPFDLMPPDEAGKIAAVFVDIVARKAPIQNLENWNLTKDGRRVCLLTSGIPLLGADGELLGYRGVDKDITNRKIAEEALIQAKLAAEEASRAKSEFLSRMSHELRTPLNAILGYTELLMEGGSDPISEDQRECLANVGDAGRHLLELINEVLDLAKVEAGKLPLSIVDVPWHDVVNQCLELTRSSADKRGIVLHDMSAGVTPWLVRADELRFKQVLLNLLSNAVKYNRAGGSVTVSAGPGEAGRLRIAVRDTGNGLTADELGQLFQPFNRLSAEGSTTEGVGIGLVISKRLLELMNGAIGVESTPGEGSTFWLELPITS